MRQRTRGKLGCLSWVSTCVSCVSFSLTALVGCDAWLFPAPDATPIGEKASFEFCRQLLGNWEHCPSFIEVDACTHLAAQECRVGSLGESHLVEIQVPLRCGGRTTVVDIPLGTGCWHWGSRYRWPPPEIPTVSMMLAAKEKDPSQSSTGFMCPAWFSCSPHASGSGTLHPAHLRPESTQMFVDCIQQACHSPLPCT